MKIGSFDVGIRNLAFCIFDEENSKILRWHVDSLPDKTDRQIQEEVGQYLNQFRAEFMECEKILIEEQPPQAKRKIVLVEGILLGFFEALGIHTKRFPASAKVNCPGRERYRERKNMSIEMTREFLQKTNQDLLEYFEKHPKKDDLADTVMQALARTRVPEKKVEKNKKVVARRPTPQQKAKKYSLPNLVWLYRNEENMENNRRFLKDLKHHFNNFEKFIEWLEKN